ncbi:hypothetical protein M436DRAFT_55636, partial [Aureobasidium namibiae CBS 147.97]
TSAPSVPKTVTLFSTKVDTITSCAEDVTNCPAVTKTSLIATGSSADAAMPSSPASAPAGPKTLTIYSSVVATITSCAADVTNCPASSTVQSTSFYAVGTTVSEVSSVPAITGSEIAPATTAPAVVASTPIQPMTTITYSSELVVPATYTAGESQGATIPESKITSTIHRTLTVPQVQFITATVGGKPTVGLTYPSAVPATTTPEAVPTSPIADAATPAVSAPAVSAASSGFAPKSSTLASTYNMPAKPTGSPISYTGAGAKVSGSFAAFAFAAVAAIFVL